MIKNIKLQCLYTKIGLLLNGTPDPMALGKDINKENGGKTEHLIFPMFCSKQRKGRENCASTLCIFLHQNPYKEKRGKMVHYFAPKCSKLMPNVNCLHD